MMLDITNDNLDPQDNKKNDIENSITNSLLVKEKTHFPSIYYMYGGLFLISIMIVSIYFLLQI